MAAKRNKAPPTAEDEVDSLFEGIADTKKAPASKKPAKPQDDDDDILAELESELKPTSRPHTPRAAAAGRRSDDKASARRSEDKVAAARKSTDSARSLRASFTPSATSSEPQPDEKRAPGAGAQQQEAAAAAAAQQGGGWWGSIFTQASAAMKTAEAAVKDLQQHEEAKKWAEHVRGNVGALRGFGTFFLPSQ